MGNPQKMQRMGKSKKEKRTRKAKVSTTHISDSGGLFEKKGLPHSSTQTWNLEAY